MGKAVIKAERRMPPRLNLGSQHMTTMAHPMGQWREWLQTGRSDERRVMGYRIPTWQRGLVWTREQKIALIESAWLGINIGTYSYNRAPIGSPYDDLLIDGQQRMSAIEGYLLDEFPAHGHFWSEVTPADRRQWDMSTHFHSLITETEDEAYLRNYYNLLNFGGTPHKENERA